MLRIEDGHKKAVLVIKPTTVLFFVLFYIVFFLIKHLGKSKPVGFWAVTVSIVKSTFFEDWLQFFLDQLLG